MSLIEQIMVLAIVAVLAGIAAPAMRRMLSRNLAQAAQTDFVAALQHAREMAVTGGRQMLFCPTRDGIHCSNEIRWENGWLLAQDANFDNQPDGAPLYSSRGYAGKLVIQSGAGRHFVRFHPDGTASGSNLTLLFCSPANTGNTLSVVVSNSGRIRGAIATPEQAAGCAQAG